MFRYIDLFCGIGGFHQGIERVATKRGFITECVFAADNDTSASEVYKNTYGIKCLYDLKSEQTHRDIDEAVGSEPLNCIFGGFPCQPFSKAGNQEGFSNQIKGTLFFEIEKIIHRHHPEFILLENVRNLKCHDGGNTWRLIKQSIESEGYVVDDVILSPNNIAKIPALRERFFILAYNKQKLGINSSETNIKKIEKKYPIIKTSLFPWNDKSRGLNTKYFENNLACDIEQEDIDTIDMWDDLHRMLVTKGRTLISPLWPHYFDEKIDLSGIPDWKVKIIKRNQEFYRENHDIYDEWYEKHKKHFDSLCQSNKKFEWNAGNSIESIWDGIIQFRPSGVRVKKPDFIPTLVAMCQTPILGPERRYMRPEEMARLYGFKKLKFGNQNEKESLKQLGNTVSVDVVEYLVDYMLDAVFEEGLYGEKNKCQTTK